MRCTTLLLPLLVAVTAESQCSCDSLRSQVDMLSASHEQMRSEFESLKALLKSSDRRPVQGGNDSLLPAVGQDAATVRHEYSSHH